MNPACPCCGAPSPRPIAPMPVRILRRDHPTFLGFAGAVGAVLGTSHASAADYTEALRQDRVESDVDPREVALAWLARRAAAAPNTPACERWFKRELDEIWRHADEHTT